MARLCSLLLCLLFLCPGVLRAETVDTEYFSVELPDAWQRLRESSSSSIDICVFATKNRDTLLTTMVGNNGGADLAAITRCFAQQYKATQEPVFRNDTGSFPYRNFDGTDGDVFIRLQDSLYMVVTTSGSLRKAKLFYKHFKSKDYPDLLPSL